MNLEEDVLHEIYCDSLQRYNGKYVGAFRDAVIVEASRQGFREEALIHIADELELRNDVECYSDAYKEVNGVRPRDELAWFRDLPSVQRMLELNLLHSKLSAGDTDL